MGWFRDPTKPFQTLLVAGLTAVFAVACDTTPGITGQVDSYRNPDGSRGVSMSPPAEWLTFRAVDPNQLELVFTLDGAPLVTTRSSDNEWNVSFTLPDDNLHTIQAAWQEVGPAGSLMLAISEEILVSNSQQGRVVTISEYLHRGLDQDNDGLSNLDERRFDLDPLVQNFATPGEGQTNCRTLTPSINFQNFSAFFAEVDSPRFASPIPITSTASFSNIVSEVTPGMLAVFESFYVLTAGELTVGHAGGPDSTGAFLYDTDSSGQLRQIAADNTRRDAVTLEFDNRRSTVTARVEPGLYCYRLESTFGNTPVLDPALQYTFVADRDFSSVNPRETLVVTAADPADFRTRQHGLKEPPQELTADR